MIESWFMTLIGVHLILSLQNECCHTDLWKTHTNCSLNQQTHPRAVHFFSWRAFLVPPGSSVASFLDQFRQFFCSHLYFFLLSVNSFWSHCRQFLVPPSIMADTFLCQKKFELSLSASGRYKQEGISLFELKSLLRMVWLRKDSNCGERIVSSVFHKYHLKI